jgi:hypothetical protein
VVARRKGDDGGTSDHWSNPNGLSSTTSRLRQWLRAKGDDGGTSDHWSNPNDRVQQQVGYDSGCEQ